jgi:hypothetical protein
MENDREWMNKYYTEDEMALLEARAKEYTPEQQAADQAEWGSLIAQAKQLAGEGADPAGEAAQELAAKWKAMVDRFTLGDPGIESGLAKLWGDRQNMPAEYNVIDDQTWQFVQSAMAARQKDS